MLHTLSGLLWLTTINLIIFIISTYGVFFNDICKNSTSGWRLKCWHKNVLFWSISIIVMAFVLLLFYFLGRDFYI